MSDSIPGWGKPNAEVNPEQYAAWCKENGTSFTVREPGQPSWSGPGLTFEQAVADRDEAIQRGLTRATIYPDNA